MLFLVEQAFVGRDEIQAPLKMIVWEATLEHDKLIRKNNNRMMIRLDSVLFSFNCVHGAFQ